MHRQSFVFILACVSVHSVAARVTYRQFVYSPSCPGDTYTFNRVHRFNLTDAYDELQMRWENLFGHRRNDGIWHQYDLERWCKALRLHQAVLEVEGVPSAQMVVVFDPLRPEPEDEPCWNATDSYISKSSRMPDPTRPMPSVPIPPLIDLCFCVSKVLVGGYVAYFVCVVWGGVNARVPLMLTSL